ncbi:Aldehyde Dehydrogenase [Ancylobacter novellus DSM 506]|uniref:Aldehyde Dehydrogenase n=1 Tax=Ancylobacter novellus (strain ATCC 8093 / DSM 506 / JCM 20403 / CCM 1077 / IAM 12100 / NBRC 12443 / NCIMB 10456) TaxID=639283 RepID=D7A3M5_ANCN5|nr:aldehyde dehydrogenase family protein [Ancylobacter novellus]ADH91652.1 Aldehyde Dehydrogenase [Ancylobacter novellus DSM 506]
MSDIVCISPIDGSELVRRPAATEAALAQALEAARAAQREWLKVPIAERSAYVLRFLDAMLAMNQEIVPELAQQMGRPVRYGGEFRGFEERVRYVVDMAEDALAPVVPHDERPGFTRYIRRDPLGIVLVVAPWNYPYLTAVNTIAPALIAGNAVLLKHAAQTILVGERFQMAMDRAGLPKGLFANLVLTHDQTSKLIGSDAVDFVNFTGSVEGGRAIERAAAGTFTPLGLELGGKDPAYVRADADFDFTVENLVDGAFYNSGQCCCGIERIYVQESLYDRFVDSFVALTGKYVLGNPLDDATTLGPMAQGRFAELIRRQTAEAVAKGAKAHLDPAAFPANREGTPYLAPQVLTGVDHSMSVMREESFGPVVGIMKVKDDDEALKLMNDSVYGLTASIWTADLEAAERIGGEVETGTVFMNRCDYLDPGLAWTGVKETGRGASLSRIGFEMLTRPKSFHLRHG